MILGRDAEHDKTLCHVLEWQHFFFSNKHFLVLYEIYETRQSPIS